MSYCLIPTEFYRFQLLSHIIYKIEKELQFTEETDLYQHLQEIC